MGSFRVVMSEIPFLDCVLNLSLLFIVAVAAAGLTNGIKLHIKNLWEVS